MFRSPSVGVGDKIGRLTVTSVSLDERRHRRIAHCACDCGNLHSVIISRLNSTKKKTRSCGCLARELARELIKKAIAARITHGATRQKQTPEYMVWAGMIQRCKNPKHNAFYNYGGRGITVDPAWMSFETFIADMGMRPSPSYSIERKNGNLPYCADNCKWATRDEQCRNTKRSHFITFGGETMNVCDWAIKLGFGKGVINRRLRLGWSEEQALSTPIGNKRK